MDKLIRSDPILEKYLLEKAMFNIALPRGIACQ